MNPEREMLRTIKAIDEDLNSVIAYYETFVPSARNAKLIDRVNKTQIYTAFNVISDSLHRNAVMSLCRIWDSRRDTASLNCIARQLRKKGSSLFQSVLATAREAWLKEMGRVGRSTEMQALRRARDRALAHTATPNVGYRGKASILKYGDERIVMEWTIALVEELNEFVDYYDLEPSAVPFKTLREVFHEHSIRFWDRIGDFDTKIERDIADGKLKRLADEALADYRKGRARDL